MLEQRNDTARRKVKELNQNHQIAFKQFANLMGVHYVSFANWKVGKFNFAESNMSKLEAIIEKYERLDD